MKNRNMALSLLDNISTCDVIFASGVTFNTDRIDPTMKRYCYAYDKNHITLVANDIVVIPGSGKYSVGRVVEVHEFSQIDISAPYDYALVTDVVKVNTLVEEQIKKGE